ncbi:MAG TPA: hypothetical protein V6C78_24950 [Crinalium sp.]
MTTSTIQHNAQPDAIARLLNIKEIYYEPAVLDYPRGQTHNDRLHEVNLGWHPQAESLLWQPDLQETKYSQTGGCNVRYKRGFKGSLVDAMCALMQEQLPYCNIRYAF